MQLSEGGAAAGEKRKDHLRHDREENEVQGTSTASQGISKPQRGWSLEWKEAGEPVKASPGLRDDENGGEAGDSGEACPHRMNGGAKVRPENGHSCAEVANLGKAHPCPPAALIRRDSEEKQTLGAGGEVSQRTSPSRERA